MSETLLKILSICLVAAVLSVVLKQKNGEYAVFISITTGVLIGLVLLKNLVSPINEMKQTLNNLGVNTEYFEVALKAVGIGYITSFISDACKDAGQISLSQKAEFAGKCAIFLLCLPLLISVFNICLGFLK